METSNIHKLAIVVLTIEAISNANLYSKKKAKQHIMDGYYQGKEKDSFDHWNIAIASST